MVKLFHARSLVGSRGSQAGALVVIHKYHKARHSGMDCRNPGYMDVFEITIPGTIGVEKSFFLSSPLPPNRACSSPAHGSPVDSFLIGIGSLPHGLHTL